MEARDLLAKNNQPKKSSSKLIVGIFISLAFVFVAIAVGLILNSNSLAPDESSALYGGRVENNAYPYAGYLIAYDASQRASICGTTYLSANLAVSAAHCFDNKVTAYLGYSLFNFNLDQNSIARDVIVNPDWDGQDVTSDIAVIHLPQDYYPIDQYASIASPRTGCNYEILGYGRTEDDSSRGQLEKLRKSATFCINDIDSTTVELIGQDGGVCFGDSGSPVFEKGTNNIVAIVSSIIAPSAQVNDPCDIGNRAVAVRVDRKISFINNSESTAYDRNNVAICGEACGFKNCAFGLVCDRASNTCQGSNGTCLAQSGDYCSNASGVRCSNGFSCSLNECVGAGDVAQYARTLQTDVQIDPSVDLDDGQYNIAVYMFYAAGGFFVLGITIMLVSKLRGN